MWQKKFDEMNLLLNGERILEEKGIQTLQQDLYYFVGEIDL
jgi:Holliday junction resolvase-like predicted endonuclease